ncbi:MAG: hypothetical protein ACTSW1_08805 [Candidatus Hodarchaeales archaeon]
MTHQKNRMIGTRVTTRENKSIERLVSEGKYLNKADFVRTAIRKVLDEHKEVK